MPKKNKGPRAWDKTPGAFARFLQGIKTARQFMTQGQVHFLQCFLRPGQRKRVFARLKEVDPEGLKRLRAFAREIKKTKAIEKELLVEEATQTLNLALAQARFEREGITRLRFCPADTILNIIAVMKAAGHSEKEIEETLGVEPELVSQVGPDQVRMVKRRLRDGILMAADQKVLRDLMQDAVDKSTDVADRIAHRHRRLILDETGGQDEGKRSMLPAQAETIKKRQDAFFTGTIDVTGEVEEVTENDEDMRSRQASES